MPEQEPKKVLRGELESALGESVDQETADRAFGGPPRSRFATVISENQLLLAITLAGAVVFGVVLSVFLDSWLFLVVAILVHGLGTLVTSGLAIRMAGSGDKPDPRTVARLEEQGVANPEQKLNQAVQNTRS
jgi:hypothetical protein